MLRILTRISNPDSFKQNLLTLKEHWALANVWQVPLRGQGQGKKIDCSGQIGIAPMGEAKKRARRATIQRNKRDGYFGLKRGKHLFETSFKWILITCVVKKSRTRSWLRAWGGGSAKKLYYHFAFHLVWVVLVLILQTEPASKTERLNTIYQYLGISWKQTEIIE